MHANPLQDANVVGSRPTILLREAERTCAGESKSITNIYSQNFVATPAHVESREVSEPDHMNHSESGGEREDGETKTSTLEEILKQEPLRHIDWTQLKKDRDDATVRLFQEFAVRRRNMFTETSVPLSEERAHGATCTIRTIEENPEIHAGYRPCPPEDAKFMREEVMRLAASRLVGPSTAGYSNHWDSAQNQTENSARPPKPQQEVSQR